MYISKKNRINQEFIPCACNCGELLERYSKHGCDRIYIHGHQMNGRKGNISNHWKGGKRKLSNGYIWIWTPNGYILEHRYIYEQYYKCCLLPWIDIHHKNGIRDDNRIENLEPKTKHDHHSYHKKKDMSNRICYICNRTKSTENHWYLSKLYMDKFVCKTCYHYHKNNNLEL